MCLCAIVSIQGMDESTTWREVKSLSRELPSQTTGYWWPQGSSLPSWLPQPPVRISRSSMSHGERRLQIPPSIQMEHEQERWAPNTSRLKPSPQRFYQQPPPTAESCMRSGPSVSVARTSSIHLHSAGDSRPEEDVLRRR